MKARPALEVTSEALEVEKRFADAWRALFLVLSIPTIWEW